MHPATSNITVFLSGHGFGHLVRTATVLSELVRRVPISLTVLTSAPQSLWPKTLRRATARWIAIPCDPTIVQRGDSEIDVGASVRAIAEWHRDRNGHLEALARLVPKTTDLVVADVAPLAFPIAAARRIPSVAIANFSWDWIYAEMGLDAAAQAAAQDYAKATLLLECIPAAPMRAFDRRETVGTVGRDCSATREEARERLGLGVTTRAALLALRPATLVEIELPPPRGDLRYLAPSGLAELRREDLVAAADELEFVDLLAASDIVVSKPGYGVIGDCVATGRPLLWAARTGFPEDSVLEPWLDSQSWCRMVAWDDLRNGTWATALRHAPPAPAAHESLGCRTALDRAATALVEILS